MPVFSANWHEAECVFQIQFAHEGSGAKVIEDCNSGVYGAVAKRVLLWINKVVNAGTCRGGEIADGAPAAIFLGNDPEP